MNSAARTVSSTLVVNEPSPHCPLDTPRPRLSKRSIPTPSAASCLQIRAAAGLSLLKANPWAKTPHPRGVPDGMSTTPARSGPRVLGKETRSATFRANHLDGTENSSRDDFAGEGITGRVSSAGGYRRGRAAARVGRRPGGHDPDVARAGGRRGRGQGPHRAPTGSAVLRGGRRLA